MSGEIAEAAAAMIASRAQERQVAFERRRTSHAQLAAVKNELMRRRRHGLAARHAAKLARTAHA